MARATGTPKLADSSDGAVLKTKGLKQVGWNVKMGEFGCTDATLSLLMLTKDKKTVDELVANYVTKKKQHEYADWLICTDAKVSHEGMKSIITLKYEGIPTDIEATKYKISAGTSEEPIDTHPDFHMNDEGTKQFAGKPSDMDAGAGFVLETGAVFTGTNDLKDTFVKFVRKNDEDDGLGENSKAGVSQYLVPDLIFEEERTLGDGFNQKEVSAIIGDLGKWYKDLDFIIKDFDGSELNIPDVHRFINGEPTYLMIGAEYQPKGKGGILKRKWRLSGLMGWNELMYEEGTDSVGTPEKSPTALGQAGDAFTDWADRRLLIAGDFDNVINNNEMPYKATYGKDKAGQETGSLLFVVDQGYGLDWAKQYMTEQRTHPHHGDYLGAYEATVTGLDGGVEQVEVKFKGNYKDQKWILENCGIGTMIEPIDTHPDFIKGRTGRDPIGGDHGNPKNAAVFNDDKTFDKFGAWVPEATEGQEWWNDRIEGGAIVNGMMPNAMKGVSSYLEVGVDWKESKLYSDLTRSLQEVKKIGKIVAPLCKNPYPPVVRTKIGNSKKRTWLMVGASWEMITSKSKSGYKVTIDYKMSGERGWDTDIYDKD
jgi:hypothetical protein